MICNLLAVSRVSPDFFDFAYTDAAETQTVSTVENAA